MRAASTRLWPAFVAFAKAQVVTKDIDPTYPVLRHVYSAERLPSHVALWRTLLYVTWYHLGTAERVGRLQPEPGSLLSLDALGWVPATGTERRAFRGARGYELARAHIEAVLRRSGGDIEGWLRRATAAGGQEGWRRLRAEWAELPWGGPWSSYKLADLLAHVHGFSITADDLGIGGGSATSGPIPGMVRLTGRSWQDCARDRALQHALLLDALEAGVPFSGLDQLETALCDFNSACKGHYYVGHDIDQQQVQFAALGPVWWEARAACFDSRYLGEQHGWAGPQAARNSAYRDRGLIVSSDGATIYAGAKP